ncbi:MAG: YihY/virulence factor BrkB family protein [Actinobacteria bacterium]|nr:YihY/virulence factor BrkB family protein [Actinomycetota bacterium]
MAEERGAGGGTLRRELVALLQKVLAHDLTQLSAALTYYTVLSLLPALIVVVALLGVVGLPADTVHALLETMGNLGADWAADFVSGVLDSVQTSRNSGAVLTVSLLTSLWASSAYVGSFMAASDRIYEITDRRPFWTGMPLRVGLALLLLVLLSAAAAVVTLVGPIGAWIADAAGVSAGSLRVWTWVKWPVLVVLALLLFSVLYKFAPSRRQPPLWWLTPGAAVGVALWLAGSALFSFYLDNFASYNRVYGTLATAVVFLVWVWLMNIALLVGVEVNREVELRRSGGSDVDERGADSASASV